MQNDGLHQSPKCVSVSNIAPPCSTYLPLCIDACRFPLIVEAVNNATEVKSSWKVMAHGNAREEKWRGNWRMEGVASTLHTTSEQVYPALLPLMRTPRLPVVGWTDATADLNGPVRFAERRNLVSALVPSHFKGSIKRRIVMLITKPKKLKSNLNSELNKILLTLHKLNICGSVHHA